MEGGLLIVGNGFDLDLGLQTRYSDFWDSDRWKVIKNTCPEQYLIKSLGWYGCATSFSSNIMTM